MKIILNGAFKLCITCETMRTSGKVCPVCDGIGFYAMNGNRIPLAGNTDTAHAAGDKVIAAWRDAYKAEGN